MIGHETQDTTAEIKDIHMCSDDEQVRVLDCARLRSDDDG